MTDLVTGDTGSTISVTCKSAAGVAINLTGATVLFRWEGAAGLVEKAATITDAPNGVCEYQFAAGEIIAPKMKIEVEITDSGGKVVTGTDLIELTVREELG